MADEITRLSPQEETVFQQWIRTNHIPDLDHPDSHYDYRGYWKEHGSTPIRFGTDHFTDTYKQHGHPTFSEESRYSKGPGDGGTWRGETFVPSSNEPIVIVDNAGNEHEFPAGFDVQRAIAIVRDSGPKPVETMPGAVNSPMNQARVKRPNSDLSAMVASDTANASLAGGRGYVKGMAGVALHPLDTARDMLVGAGQQLGSAVSGLYGAATHSPAETFDTVKKGFTEGIPNAIGGVLQKAATDPEGYGEDVGRMTGQTMAGIAAGSTGRFLPKAAARTLGAGFESVGGKGGTLAFRVAGLGQLANGNPAGLATLLLPETFRKTGQAMQRWGTEPGALAATPEGMFLQVQQDMSKAASDPKVAEALSSQLDKLRAQAAQLRTDAKLPSDMATAQKMTDRIDKLTAALSRTTGPAKNAAQAEAENAANLQRIKDARAGLKPTDPVFRESVSATDPTGAKQSMSQSFKPEDSAAAAGPKLSAADREMLAKLPAAQRDAILAGQNVVGPAPAIRPPVRIAPSSPMQPPPEAAGVAPVPTGPVAPPAPPAASAPNVAPIRVAGDKVATNARELASKSRSGAMSATPGFTVNDLESVGLNPRLNYKSLTPELLDQLKANRATRADTYRINAGMDTGSTNAAGREPMTLQEQLEASLRARQGEQ